MTTQEAIEILKFVPLYRYELKLKKGRQSDLFNALNMAIEALEKQISLERVIERLEDNAKRCGYCEKGFKDSIVKVSLSQKWFEKRCSYETAIEIIKEEVG